LHLTGREQSVIELVEAYAKVQGLWHSPGSIDPLFTDTLQLDLSTVEPSLAGPKRPQDRVSLSSLITSFDKALEDAGKMTEVNQSFKVDHQDYALHHGDMVIAAITSCTNTSNPNVLMAAGLLAKKAIEKGLKTKPWVKTSLAPGSKVVTDYLAKAGLQTYLNELGFELVGYGCTTCIGNSGPLPDPIAKTITDNDLVVSAVLSGNRNFEGRVHPQVKANWLASPPLVVAFALAGTARKNLATEPLGDGKDGKPVYLKDIWPTAKEIADEVAKVDGAMFRREYADVFTGDDAWRSMPVATGKTYQWDNNSTYVQNPPYFEHLTQQLQAIEDIKQANVLAIFGDSITTDHISPAGAIKADSPAGKYLIANGVSVKDFNSYGSRRGNHEVMMRGTFANIRIRNEMIPGIEGGLTRYIPSGEIMPIYDAAMKYQADKKPLVIFAGKEYGTGSSRDWAAKGTILLGVKAIIAESFERIHRSNLIGMGVLPLEFKRSDNRKNLNLVGTEIIDILGLEQNLKPKVEIIVRITRADGTKQEIATQCRIDTQDEAEYYKNGGILQYMLRELGVRS
jgi:aconitate hydratase